MSEKKSELLANTEIIITFASDNEVILTSTGGQIITLTKQNIQNLYHAVFGDELSVRPRAIEALAYEMGHVISPDDASLITGSILMDIKPTRTIVARHYITEFVNKQKRITLSDEKYIDYMNSKN